MKLWAGRLPGAGGASNTGVRGFRQVADTKNTRDSQRICGGLSHAMFSKNLILSVLETHPSARDTRVYLRSFAPETSPFHVSEETTPTTAFVAPLPKSKLSERVEDVEGRTALAKELMQPTLLHTGLVKIQGPFTDRQLASIAEGMVYLKRLGLVSIILIDHEEWQSEVDILQDATLPPEDRNERMTRLRARMKHETLRFSDFVERQGGSSRPLLEGVLEEVGHGVDDSGHRGVEREATAKEAVSPHATAPPITSLPASSHSLRIASLSGIRDAIRTGDIPVIPPIALAGDCASRCVGGNAAFLAVSAGLADHVRGAGNRYDSDVVYARDVDLTPVRLMVINREGGIPSPARNGAPHLSINLQSEFDHIMSTFAWSETHPTSLANLKMIRACLADLPRTASAVVVSHRSPKSLIANLITNKPAYSPSLHPSLLSPKKAAHQPTIVRWGLPIKVHRSMADIDREKLTRVLEKSFQRELVREPFFARLEADLDFCIVAGDYDGVAIVTNEYDRRIYANAADVPREKKIAYLDKFAVLPSLQGDGTVDFLWGALRDESFGLGVPNALNSNVGGLQGRGEGRDLVWRSRANNPVNKWYFERSNGFFRIPPPEGSPVGFALFWCDAEAKIDSVRRNDYLTPPEKLQAWSDVVGAIPSCWVPL